MFSATVLNQQVGPIGYGLLGLTMRGQEKPFDTSITTMRRAVELGATSWNGGEIYGTPERNSLHLLVAYFSKHPADAEKVLICIKGGALPGSMQTDGSEKNVRRSVDECLRILGGTKKLDIFEMARVDKAVGNETAIRVLAEYVKEGKIGGIGLSEVNSNTIREAVRQVPGMIASVELELSLWTPDILQNGIMATCAEFELPVFAYSPLARGTISGQRVRKNADLPDGDFRKITPRFTDENLAVNNRIVDAVEEIAERKGATIAQIAIGWVRGQSGRTRRVKLEDGSEKVIKMPAVIPIPGASTIERVEENSKDVRLTEEELVELDKLIEQFPVQGDRYHAFGMKYVNS